MSLSVVIPFTDRHELTERCVKSVLDRSDDRCQIILVDNGSVNSTRQTWLEQFRNVYFEENKGVFPAIRAGLDFADADVVLCMHNDVLIHEQNFDQRILKEFEKDGHLGIAGFFGARGVARDGGRMHPESNMKGLEWGQHGSIHGTMMNGTSPAVVFDSLALVIRKSILHACFTDDELDAIAPHHWFDRILTLKMVLRGFHALTIGVAFDHLGGGTSVANPAFDAATKRWCEQKGIDPVPSADAAMYAYGRRQFEALTGTFPVQVDSKFRIRQG